MQKEVEHLKTLKERRDNPKVSPIEISYRSVFKELLQGIDFKGKEGIALSVSTGDGLSDYLVFSDTGGAVRKIIATDIVDNPVDKSGIEMLREMGDWEFRKVTAEKPFPFPDESFDLVFHQDVIEHVKKPYLFISEQYRVLKKGGSLIMGTPNLFRPANLVKLTLGNLRFPVKIGENEEIGDYVHIQEFNEFQIKNLLEEVGFEDIEVKHCYFGIWPLRITFSMHPEGKPGKGMCHYLMVRCRK